MNQVVVTFSFKLDMALIHLFTPEQTQAIFEGIAKVLAAQTPDTR